MNVNEIKQVVQVLAAAIKGLRLYAVNHPATVKQVESLQNGLFGLLQHKKIIKMGLVEGTLFVEDHLFMDEFPAATELATDNYFFALIYQMYQFGYMSLGL